MTEIPNTEIQTTEIKTSQRPIYRVMERYGDREPQCIFESEDEDEAVRAIATWRKMSSPGFTFFMSVA